MSGVPTVVDAQIESHILAASARGLAAVAAPGRDPSECEHVVKYTAAQYGGRYPPSPNAVTSPGLFVSSSPGFTWGPGTYVCPVAYPLSTAIYGRCGIVSRLPDTRGWRIFDATDTRAAQFYVQWASLQPLFTMLTLTAHANWANHLLRTLFKTRFRIDVVVFPPDEIHNHYTNRATDRWLTISEWTPARKLASGVNASWPISPRFTVILAEEFQTTSSAIRRTSLIGPTPTFPANKPTPAAIISAYAASDYLWVPA